MPVIPSEPAPHPFLGADDAPEPRESEYGPDGLYRYGPQRARPITARLAALTIARCPDAAPPPTVARAQARIKQQRARASLTNRQRMIAAIMGAPAGRTRRAA